MLSRFGTTLRPHRIIRREGSATLAIVRHLIFIIRHVVDKSSWPNPLAQECRFVALAWFVRSGGRLEAWERVLDSRRSGLSCSAKTTTMIGRSSHLLDLSFWNVHT